MSQNGTSASLDASEPTVELREVLGSRSRRNGSHPGTAPTEPLGPTTVRLTDRAPAGRAAGRKNLLVVLMFLGIAACGVYVGVRSTSIGDALRTVSVVLVVTAVLIYLTALLFWLRGRRRPATVTPSEMPVAAPRTDTVAMPPVSAPTAPSAPAGFPVGVVPPTVAAPVLDPVGASPSADVGAGTPPRVPTLAEIAAQLDASRGRRPNEAPAAPTAPSAVVPPPPAAPAPTPAPTPAPAAVAPTPAAVAPSPVVPPPVPEPPVVVPAPPVAAPAPDDDGAVEVIHAIAPYAEVVGAPVIRERAPEPTVIEVGEPAASAPVAAVVPAPPVRPSAPVPPPPPVARTVVPPPPPAPSGYASPPARSAAEVFAAMAAAAPVETPRPAPAVEHVPPPPPPVPAPPAVAATPIDRDEVEAAAHPGAALGTAHLQHTSSEFVDLFADRGDRERTDDLEPTAAPLSGADLVVAEPLVPAAETPGWTPPPVPADAGMVPHVAAADVTARSAVGSVAPVIVYRYRKWVLGQMMPGAAFGPIDVDRSPDEWLLLATCGVATLLAWTHEDHHFTYPVETWAEEILPAHGVRIRDRELARDLLLAAALHAGGVDSVPTERLRTYEPADLVTAMASIHVGLLRLYCGLGRIGPERVLADQYGIGPGDIPLH